MEEQLICIGCGVQLQTTDKHKLGYAPPAALKRDEVLCQRCFRIKHYGEVQDVPLGDDDYLKLLDRIGRTEALVVKIVDCFDFSGSWIPGIHRYAGSNDVFLVGNKIDLLPRSTNGNRLKDWMRRSAKELGLRAKDVWLISAETGAGVEAMAAKIDEYRNGKDVYIIGCTNVGKSTLINRFIRQFSRDDRPLITTSMFPGTTLNLIDLPLEDGKTLYDTPGVINRHQIAHYLNNKELKHITPKKEVKPVVFQLDEAQTLFFGGLARLDYIHGGHRSFVCYFSNELYIHRTKLEKADSLYESQVGKLLTPPQSNRHEKLPPLVKHDFSIREEKTDVVFSGLGWITVHGGRGRVTAYAPKGVGVTVRASLI